MLLTRLLNACHHFPGFVYEGARLCEATQSIEIEVRPRKGSKPICSCCNRPGRGYDTLGQRRFEFIPGWGFAVFLLYAMRRVDCGHSGVKVEQVPWASGKHTLTKERVAAYSIPPNAEEVTSLRVVVRPHINRNVAELLAGDIVNACKFLETHGGNATPPALHAHGTGKAATAKC